ncbi:DUF4145 domain-containing protein [Opitutus terrae]|uniref:DUF4145 domain-containing protein n=1 Tax=Opitutus terrae (strain DSM 11246 / JCM 15787 / PB90-1) TaxID=452637 RepID=B1ZMJ6_OPITP|nr:DUF4145 domain-containing protein [Opitutus terrae]ACB74341.1 conserved hypothetical protein [Opitutus terrae PB90-1]
MNSGEKLKSVCNTCHAETLHDVLFEKKENGSEDITEDFLIQWGARWRVIQCRGCESIAMRLDAWNSEALDEKGRPEVETKYFPPRIFRQFPKWLRGDVLTQTCPDEVEGLMKELYVALQNDSRAAATMLIRAIFEHTMIDKVGDQKSFTANLNKFEAQGFIGKKHREVVGSMLEAGHASIHRAFVPAKEDLITLVDILEGVLQVVYVQVPKADEMKKRIPKRK